MNKTHKIGAITHDKEFWTEPLDIRFNLDYFNNDKDNYQKSK